MPVLPPTPTPNKKKVKPSISERARAMAAIRTGNLKSMEKTGWKSDGKMLIGDIRKKFPRLKRRVSPIKHYGLGKDNATMPKWGKPRRHRVPVKRVNPKGIV